MLVQKASGDEKNCPVPPESTFYRAPTAVFDQHTSRPQSMLPPKRPTTAQSQTSGLLQENNDITWKELSETFGRFLFCTFSILLAFLTVVFFLWCLALETEAPAPDEETVG